MKKLLCAMFLSMLLSSLAFAAQGPFLRKRGVEAKVNFMLLEVDGVDIRADAVHASGDTKIMKDEGAEANTANGFVDEGQGYSITLTATEMEAARIAVYIVDSATKVWLDETLYVETYGHADAQHAVDLDDGVRAGLTALPDAAADAAGGLPISDAGGLDLDTQIGTDIDAILVDTSTTLDGIVDAILVDTDTTLDAVVDAILVDTADMQEDWATAIASIAAIEIDTAAVDTDSELQTLLCGEASPPLTEDDAPTNWSAMTISAEGVVDVNVSDVNITADTSAIVDGIWDEAAADHRTPGTTGASLKKAAGFKRGG